jgi:hypothetical protein
MDSRDLVRPVDESVDAITDKQAPHTTEDEQL